jgi:hypothetical protein
MRIFSRPVCSQVRIVHLADNCVTFFVPFTFFPSLSSTYWRFLYIEWLMQVESRRDCIRLCPVSGTSLHVNRVHRLLGIPFRKTEENRSDTRPGKTFGTLLCIWEPQVRFSARTPTILTKFLCDFPQLLQKYSYSALKGHNFFLPNPHPLYLEDPGIESWPVGRLSRSGSWLSSVLPRKFWDSTLW